jgi:hypothetical protein
MTAEEYADKHMKRYVTSCCKVAPTTVGRVHSVCSNCGKDVSLEMIFIYDVHYEIGKKKTDGSSTKT